MSFFTEQFEQSSYPHTRHAEKPANAGQSAQPTCTVVVIDGNSAEQDVTVETLKQAEPVRAVKIFPGGASVVDYFKEQGFYHSRILNIQPVIVLLDINMPNLNGFEVLQDIKTDPILKEVPVIVLSSERQDYKVIQALRLGADGYLLKPLEIERLEGYLNSGL